MSENLDLVRAIYADWERGDFGSAEWAHPDIEYVRDEVISSSRWRGPAGLAEGTRNFMAAWRGMRFEAAEYRQLDDERVLVLFRYIGHGKQSGLALDKVPNFGAHLFSVRNGEVVKLIAYFDRQRAFADLGLKE
jgi:ketosteroid isomerase-like protein